MKNKKILLIISAIILLIIFLIVLWNSDKTKDKNAAIKVDQEKTVTATKISDYKFFFPFIKQDASVVGLYDLGRYFYNYNPNDMELKQINSGEILSPIYLTYSPSGSKALIVSFYPTTNIQFYDLSSDKISELSNNILEIMWSKSEDKIYYSYRDVEKDIYQINYSKPDGSDWHTLVDGEKEKDSFEISPDESKMIFYNELTGVAISQSYIYDINSKEKTTLDKNIDINKAYWSPNSQKIAYLDQNNHLSIIDSNGQNNSQTDIVLGVYMNKWHILESDEVVLSEEVLWKDNENLVLAIPDDFSVDSIIAPTSLYIYNITNKQLTKLNIGDQTFAGISLVSIQNNKTLYFTSDDLLYKVDLL